MHTLRHTASLLAAADSVDTLLPVAALLGFTEDAQPLDADARSRLGLPGTLVEARLIRGRGALRTLVVALPPTPAPREQLALVAAALRRTTAHVLWIVLATSDDMVGIACWSAGIHSARVAALVADRRRVVPSDAEAIGALAAVAEGEDLLVHARWCELLGREALTRRFYRTLEQRVGALARSLRGVPAADAAELALLVTSRLLFLCFLQAKGWLNGERGFLAARFDECMASGGGFHQRVLLPLFFGTLNTPVRDRAARARGFGAVPFLNGGLFARAALERRHRAARFGDEAFGALFAELLDAYRFTAREDDAEWSEVAIDPEMLGRAFESLMAARERRTSGAFYTPQALVAHVADAALRSLLARASLQGDAVDAALRGERLPPQAAAALTAVLRDLAVLDPSCGSGAFLVYLLERITLLHRASGDDRPTSVIRRSVLARTIHGVDVNPTAVWLCELRLWLCIVIGSEERSMRAVVPLPNLDGNVRVGDALAGDGFEEPAALVGPPAALVRLRERYARAAGARKAPLRRALAREERRRALATIDRALAAVGGQRRERLLARRSPDLFGERRAPAPADREAARSLRARAAALRRERRRLADGGALPFAFPSHFGHAEARGGFDVVVGNPPWVRVHNIPPASRRQLRERFLTYRDAGWQPAPTATAPMRGFGAQVDLAALFVERSLGLTTTGGTVALLLPAKLWRSLSGGAVRRLVTARATLLRLEDWTDAPCAFDAAVYPSIMIARREPTRDVPVTLGVRRGTLALEWEAPMRRCRFDRDPASPWLVMPREVRTAFDLVSSHGLPLGDAVPGRPTLGVKCGCNDAFTVQLSEPLGDVTDERQAVEHLGRRGAVERAVLRPLLRGDALSAWSVAPSRSAILWTHAPGGRALPALPGGAARWLAPWRDRLAARADLRGAGPWWTLFRTEAADAARPRVVWADFGRAPRAALIPAGAPVVPLNSCYVLPCDELVDALAITALLNGPVAAAWLNALAEPARGGWHRYLAWTVALLPLPRDWPDARALLAPLAEQALVGRPPSPAELMEASCRAYRIRPDDVAPLVAWCR